MTAEHHVWIWRRVAAVTLAMMLATGAINTASAGTLDFEGLACQDQFGVLAGFTFSSAWVTQCDDDYSATWGNPIGAPSSATAAGNTYLDPSVTVTITRAQPFDLLSGMASAFLVNGDLDFATTQMSSSSLMIEGYLGGVFVSSLSLNFDPATGGLAPGFHPFGSIVGVDELRFFSAFDQDPSAAPNHWLVDDLVFADATAVPEPASSLFLGFGLGALGAGALHCRRRFQGHPSERSAS
jgi:MYXO-CTERM domain-containing protein